jgi:uncharacterized membrane protein YedE/YeeE
MKLSPKGLGLSLGILWGISVFLTTLWIMWKGGGETLQKLSQIYLGYSVTLGGAIIGLVWGFVDGLIMGTLIAVLYNAFAGKE